MIENGRCWRILLISDEPTDYTRIQQCFSPLPQVHLELYQIGQTAPSYETILRPDFDIFILNHNTLYPEQAQTVLKQLNHFNLNIPIFLISNQEIYEPDPTLVQCGASDMIPKHQLSGLLLHQLFSQAVSKSDNESVVQAALNIVSQQLQTMKTVNACLQAEVAEHKQTQIELAEKAAQLAEKNEELNKFASIVSHDLQEPLRMVASYMQLLSHRYTDQLDDDAKLFIHHAVDGTKRMKTLIQDLLAYSRLSARQATRLETDLNLVLQNVLANLDLRIKESNAQLHVSSLPTLFTVPAHMLQLLQNLLSNALKFHAKERPLTITISAFEENEFWDFAIEDNGIGMDMRFSSEIFDVFRRLHPRDQYREGTGMGLAICQRIVQQHGGEIWVESESDVGSTFYFSLPKHHTEKA